MKELSLLRKTRLFKALTQKEILQISKILRLKNFKKGKTILKEGGNEGSLYIVKKGELKVSHLIRGRRRDLGTFRAGDHFGEISFIDRKPRSATVHTSEESELWVMNRKHFDTLLKRDSGLQIKILEALLEDLCNKLRDRKFSLDFELSDLLPIAVFEIDRKGNITFANRNGLDCFGYSETDFEEGLTLFEMLSQKDRFRARQFLKNIYSSNQRGMDEFSALSKEGRSFPVLFHAERLTSEEEVIGVRTTLLDITDRKQAESALKESQESHRTIMESASDAIITIDEKSKIHFANPAVEEIFGYKPEKIIGKPLTILMPAPLRKLHKKSLHRYISTGEKNIPWHGVELTGRHSDGHEITLEISFAEFVERGKRFFTGFIPDIRERKKTEQGLRQLKKAVQNMRIGVTISDTKGKILYTNPAEARMHGYKVEELIGKNVRIFAPQELWQPVSEDLLKEFTHMARESVNVKKDGTRFPVQIISDVIRDKAGRAIEIVTSSEDITPRKEMERALRDARDSLEQRVLERTADLKESERRLEEMMENVQLISLMLDTNGNITFCNDYLLQLTQYSREDILGENWFEIFLPVEEGYEIEHSFFRSVRQGRIRPHRENHILTQSGKRLLISWNNTLLRDRHGEVIGTASIGSDITDRRRSEESLRQSEERYRRMIESIEDGYYECDLAGNFVFFNQSLCKMLGYSKQEMLGLNNRDYMDPETAAQAYALFNRIYRTDESVREFECEVFRKDKTRISVDISGTLIRNVDDEPAGFRGIIRDVTMRKQAEADKHELEEHLRRAQRMEEMGRLVAGVAHEVRNPLNAIQATTEALQQDLAHNPEYASYLQVVRSQVARLSELMRDLLELGRPADAARMQEESMSQLCMEAVHLWRQTAQNSGHSVTLNLPEESRLKFQVDGARFQQVLLNVLDNASQHSRAGSKIEITSTELEDMICLRVKDEGTGVSQENLKRIFDPFFTTRRGGIGLGLSLVKHIVESHSGEVRMYNNDPAPGCTVEIVFRSSSGL
ncbi:PAS domain S-box protein [bacterium]|nr:PAS domain S-box protein [bacterium]